MAGRRWPVVLPTARDPRVHLAAVIVSLQVLGQAALGFEVSIAQILVAVATCALLEAAVTFRRRGVIAWPASALLTGNGVAFILRVPGTRHGDWWSLRGAWIFAAVAAVALLSKYVIRVRSGHLFNPSNFGLVAGFVLLGSRRANPQDLWWGPMSLGLAIAVVVIVVGGLSILGRIRMLGLATAFWVTFAAANRVTTAAGHCMTARWHVGPLCGSSYWSVVTASPEILVFLFFMITDPKTAPAGRVARVCFGAGVGFGAALLAAPAPDEFWTKVAVLGALTVGCALRPTLERALPAAGDAEDGPAIWAARVFRVRGRVRGLAAGGVVVVAGVALLVAAGLPARAPAGAAPRPVGASDLDGLPAVDLPPATTAADPALTEAEARRMAADAIVDLRNRADAIERRDPTLARTSLSGAALADALAEIGSGGTGPTTASYRLDRITAVVVPDRANPQGSPRIGLHLHGTADSADGPVPVDITIGLRSGTSRYLIDSLPVPAHAAGRP